MPQNMHLLIQPNAITLAEDSVDASSIPAIVKARVFRGQYCQLIAEVESVQVTCFIANEGAIPEPGRPVVLRFDMTRSMLIS
jgi:hypothetical protein